MLSDIRKYWFIKLLLYPLSVLYGLLTDLRNFFYSSGIFKIWTSEVPVISIGNIITGGTGKTPLTMLCVDLLKDRYKKIVVVSRGYGRKSKGLQIVSDGLGNIISAELGGDEPVMIAMSHSTVPVIVSESRKEGITLAIDEYNADLIVLDDAFQHRKVFRNCDLLLIPGNRRLKTEQLLPLGNLREKLENLRRASIILINTSQGPLNEADMEFLDQNYNGPVVECAFKPEFLVNSRLEKCGDTSDLREKSAYVFCAIAGPDKFVKALTSLGVKIQKVRKYPDHYFYTSSDFESIKQEYQALKCDYLVTTEKDMVKIDSKIFKNIDLIAVGLKGTVNNAKSFVDKLNQFIDIKM
jgi:tetraacyldisaccharide 4'-kinase